MVEGDVTAVDLDQLDPGAQYEVQVIAIIQNREGNPVSVRITTRESHLFFFTSFSYYPKYIKNFKNLGGCTVL